jgi:hypothetical protein
MKGQIEDITWTIILYIFVVVITLAIIITLIVFVLSGKDPRIFYSVEFLDLSNRPYTIIEFLSQMWLEDRIILEHSLEAMLTGDVKNSNSENIPDFFRGFTDLYKFRYYDITVSSSTKTVVKVDTPLEACGNNKDGFCASGSCPEGSDPHSPGANGCGFLETCCKERYNFDRKEYVLQGSEIACGFNDEGICANARGYGCGNGRVLIDDPRHDCTGMACTSTGCYGTICCRPLLEEDLVEKGTVTRAAIPLLYTNTDVGYFGLVIR